MVTIGFVYDDVSHGTVELENIMQELERWGASVEGYVYALDADGEQWVEKQQSDMDFYSLMNYYYGNITGKLVDSKGTQNLCFELAIQKEVDFYGFVIRLNAQDTEKYSVQELEEILINWTQQLMAVSNVNYAYCDFDAEVDFHPREIKKINKRYSIVFWPEKQLIKNAWKIDGFSNR